MSAISETRQSIIDEARTWVGTPFEHQGREKGVAVDCIGLLYGVAKVLGIGDTDMTTEKAKPYQGYSKIPHDGMLEKALNEYLVKIPCREIQPGDIYMMQFMGSPMHVCITTGETIIHSLQPVKKCTEHSLSSKWRSRICGCYRFPGIG